MYQVYICIHTIVLCTCVYLYLWLLYIPVYTVFMPVCVLCIPVYVYPCSVYLHVYTHVYTYVCPHISMYIYPSILVYIQFLFPVPMIPRAACSTYIYAYPCISNIYVPMYIQCLHPVPMIPTSSWFYIHVLQFMHVCILIYPVHTLVFRNPLSHFPHNDVQTSLRID